MEIKHFFDAKGYFLQNPDPYRDSESDFYKTFFTKDGYLTDKAHKSLYEYIHKIMLTLYVIWSS